VKTEQNKGQPQRGEQRKERWGGWPMYKLGTSNRSPRIPRREESWDNRGPKKKEKKKKEGENKKKDGTIQTKKRKKKRKRKRKKKKKKKKKKCWRMQCNVNERLNGNLQKSK